MHSCSGFIYWPCCKKKRMFTDHFLSNTHLLRAISLAQIESNRVSRNSFSCKSQRFILFYYNKDVILGRGSCWFSSSMVLSLKSACLQFCSFPHGHKMAATLPRIKSCILVRKHRAAQGISLIREANPPQLHLIDKNAINAHAWIIG